MVIAAMAESTLISAKIPVGVVTGTLTAQSGQYVNGAVSLLDAVPGIRYGSAADSPGVGSQ
jgi:hypothetical protein